MHLVLKIITQRARTYILRATSVSFACAYICSIIGLLEALPSKMDSFWFSVGIIVITTYMLFAVQTSTFHFSLMCQSNSMVSTDTINNQMEINNMFIPTNYSITHRPNLRYQIFSLDA